MVFQHLTSRDTKPLNLQLTEVLQKMIRSKKIPVGKKLPSQDELERIFKVSNDTVNGALAILVKEGYITRRPRHGTFVISDSPKKTIDLSVRNEVCLVVGTAYFEGGDSNPKFTNLIKNLEESARQKKMHLIFKTISGNDRALGFE